jgi:hypothetical protein
MPFPPFLLLRLSCKHLRSALQPFLLGSPATEKIHIELCHHHLQGSGFKSGSTRLSRASHDIKRSRL